MGEIDFTKEYVSIIESIKKYGMEHFKKLDYSKVYYTYSHYSGTKQIGEEKLESFFKEHGYQIIAPEKYSFKEQLNILLNCTHFASTIGSCSHNIMFMKEGSNVVLIPRANYLTGYQVAIDSVTDLNVYYVSSDLSILVNQSHPWDGPFYYYISDKLMSFFKCDSKQNKFNKDNLRDFRLYLRLGVNKTNNLMQCVYPDYYKVPMLEAVNKYLNGKKSIAILRKYKVVQAYVKLRNKMVNLVKRV